MDDRKTTLTPETVAESLYMLAQNADATIAAQFFDWNGDSHPW
ncbi:MAG: hypothetical protein AAFY33_14475 [Cyanobacteria bacterium J06643_4]